MGRVQSGSDRIRDWESARSRESMATGGKSPGDMLDGLPPTASRRRPYLSCGIPPRVRCNNRGMALLLVSLAAWASVPGNGETLVQQASAMLCQTQESGRGRGPRVEGGGTTLHLLPGFCVSNYRPRCIGSRTVGGVCRTSAKRHFAHLRGTLESKASSASTPLPPPQDAGSSSGSASTSTSTSKPDKPVTARKVVRRHHTSLNPLPII